VKNLPVRLLKMIKRSEKEKNIFHTEQEEDLESVHSTTAASSTNSDSKFLPEETKNSIGTHTDDNNFNLIKKK
jgi:hypothetical protein